MVLELLVLSAYLHEGEISEDLLKLLLERASLIERIANFSNAIARQGYETECDDINSAIEVMYRIEKEIATYMLDNNIQIEWYHPTNPKKEWSAWEEQNVSVCVECGAMYDSGTSLLIKKNGHYVSECPKCKCNKLILDNKYLCLGKRLNQEAEQLESQGEVEKSIKIRKQEIEQLRKVDAFYDEEYKKAIYRQLLAYGDISFMHFQMGHLAEANDEVENALVCGQMLNKIDKSKGFYGSMSQLYYYRMKIRMNLPGYSMNDVFLDYKESLKYNTENHQEYVKITENLKDIPEEEKREVFRAIEEMRVRVYVDMSEYYLDKGWLGKSREILLELKAYIPTCQYISENVLIGCKELVNNGALQNMGVSKKEGCYIATAVYGNYDAPQVIVLRRFRDTVLQENLLGRLFIKIYYRCSPPMAAYLKNTVCLNSFVRRVLDKFVESIGKN